MKSNFRKKDLIRLVIVYLSFRLTGQIFLSNFDNKYVGTLLVFIFELFPVLYTVVVYLSQRYSFKYYWEFPLLGFVNLIIPTYWMVFYNIYDGFAPRLLMQHSWLSVFVNLLYFFVLILAVSRQKKNNTEE